MLIKGTEVRITDNVEIKKGLSTFLNPYSYYLIRKEINILSDFKHIYCDGILFVIMMKFLRKNVKRVSFDMTSLAPVVFKTAEAKNLTISLVGGEEGVVEKAIINFKENFPSLEFVYSHTGFFQGKQDRSDVITRISKINPDIVIVGMGAVLQEKFLIDLCNEGWNGYGYTCGGFLHQSASKKGDYYPTIINKFNLRWLYRIYKEPKLVKRYFVVYPKAIVLLFLDVMSSKC